MASYFTIIIPIIILIVKAVLRYNNQFHQIDPKSELEKNIAIAPNLVQKIQQLMPAIQGREDNPQIEWLSKRHTGVFRLTEDPQLVFKIHTAQGVSSMINGKFLNGEQQIRNRFENMIKAKEICLAHQLDLITIPQAKIFDVEAQGRTLPVIAEQSLDIRATESAQEELYRDHAQGLGRTVRQLATFIAKTGFNDVIWRNIPVQDDALQFQGARRVALIDLEHMGEPKAGILGSWNGSCGLVRCLFSEEQIDAVLAEARQQGIITQQEAQETKARRMEEIRSNRQLLEFYQRNGILDNHRKPLAVDLGTLGLDLNEQPEEQALRTGTDNEGGWRSVFGRRPQPVTMRQVAEATVGEINRLIQETADNESVKGKRYILLNTNHGVINEYNRLGGYEEGSSWLHRIINALVAKGHLFKLDKVNGHGYFIQA